jgi:hypothetical protein
MSTLLALQQFSVIRRHSDRRVDQLGAVTSASTIADIRYGRSADDSDSFSLYEGRPRIGASSDVSHLSLRNQLARCLCGQTSRGRLPAPSLQPCKMHVQMRPRPCSREIGRSLSARVPLPPGVRALAQCEHSDNTRSGSCPLHSRTAVATCAVPVRPPSPGQQVKRLVRPSCAPTPEPSTRLYLRASEEEQIRQNSAPHVLLGRQGQSAPSLPLWQGQPTRNRPTSTHDRNPPAVMMSP